MKYVKFLTKNRVDTMKKLLLILSIISPALQAMDNTATNQAQRAAYVAQTCDLDDLAVSHFQLDFQQAQAMELNEDEMATNLTRTEQRAIRRAIRQQETRIHRTEHWLDTYYDNTEIDKRREKMMQVGTFDPLTTCKEMTIITCMVVAPLAISCAYNWAVSNNYL